MSDLFPRLDPPPGGLARLRAKLDAAEAPRRSWRPAAALAAAAIVLVAMFVVLRPPRRGPELALLTPPAHPVVARDGSSVEPVSATDDVLFYRIGAIADTVRPE